jgi:hypothetical protein
LLSLSRSVHFDSRCFLDSLDLERGSLGDTQKHLDLVPELGETSLGSLGLGLESIGDLSDFSLHTSVEDDNSSSTFGDLGTRENKADSVTVFVS